jgi:hypothetical protein
MWKPRSPYEQGDVDELLKLGPSVQNTAVLQKLLAMVRRDNYYGVVKQVLFFKECK